MQAVLTGDIVNSSQASVEEWLPSLKAVLDAYGQSPRHWEIFRGDSFQLLLPAKPALQAAFHAKSVIKQHGDLDVRIAIGIGEVDYRAERITESNGEVFKRSGRCFDQLKKQTLGIETGEKELDQTLNLMLDLACLTFDGWSAAVAKVVQTAIENPTENQEELRKLLGLKAQSSISEALRKAGYGEMKKLEKYYRKAIQAL